MTTSLKYVAIVMRVDIRHGERPAVTAIGILSTALLSGEDAITPGAGAHRICPTRWRLSMGGCVASLYADLGQLSRQSISTPLTSWCCQPCAQPRRPDCPVAKVAAEASPFHAVSGGPAAAHGGARHRGDHHCQAWPSFSGTCSMTRRGIQLGLCQGQHSKSYARFSLISVGRQPARETWPRRPVCQRQPFSSPPAT